MRDARDAARSLRQFAKRGRVVPEENDPNIRELFVQNYRLIYRIHGDAVEVIHFIHGARDLVTLLRRR